MLGFGEFVINSAMSLSNFSWIREGELAVSGQPRGLHDLLDARERGIRAVVALTEEANTPSEFEECGLVWIHLPVTDFHPPTLAQLRAFTEFAEEQRSHGNALLIHCAAGHGRSGTVAACHFVSQGMEPAAALAEIRRLRPGSVETAEQEDIVRAWAEHIRSRSEPE